MSHIRELLAHQKPGPSPKWSTGLAALDELTGGFRPGEVWLVTGTPGQGCTTLLSQWAGKLAMQHALPTWLLCPREDTQSCAARLLASTGKLPMRDLIDKRYDHIHTAALREARGALARSELFVRVGSGVSIPAGNDDDGNRAVLVDDADLVNGISPARVRGLANDGAVVIAALPRHLLVQDRHPDGDLDPDWARVADVIVEIRSRRLHETVPGDRNGEAEMTVFKFRRGPTMVITLAFQGHYARFVDLR